MLLPRANQLKLMLLRKREKYYQMVSITSKDCPAVVSPKSSGFADVSRELSIHARLAFTTHCTDTHFCIWLLLHHLIIRFLLNCNHPVFYRFETNTRYTCTDLTSDTFQIALRRYFYEGDRNISHWLYCITTWQKTYDKHCTTSLKRWGSRKRKLDQNKSNL